jgi:hypothetical protein
LILSASRGAKRWFIKTARQEPMMFGRFRRYLRGRARKRHAKSADA